MNLEKKEPVIGFLCAFGAFVTWGVLAIYWSFLFHLPALTILSYRILWSWVFVALIIALGQRWGAMRGVFGNRRALLLTVLSGVIINLNWGIYIYAITIGKVMEASMGYYMNPLVNAFFGALFFGERMRRLQKAAIFLAFVGVSYMVLGYGAFPVFAVSMALTFAAYGALHKFVKMGVFESMFCEMSVTVLPACAYLLLFSAGPSFLSEAPSMMLLIAVSGPITVLPLMGFAAAVKRLSLTTVGVIQYVSPTITFFCAVFYFKEPVNRELLTVFCFIWAGVALYLFDGLAYRRFIQKQTYMKSQD